MAIPLILLFVLTVATCGIAYWSDNLGKKLGKKRISLLGLRPRQTATLITMATSVVIMLVTMAVLLIAYVPLREALTRYAREKADNVALRVDNYRISKGVKELEAQDVALQEKIVASRKEAKAAASQLAAAQALVLATSRQVTASQAQLHSVQGNLASARSALLVAQRGESAARSGADLARQRLARVKGQMADTLKKVAVANANLIRVVADTKAVMVANKGLMQENVRIASAATEQLDLAQHIVTTQKAILVGQTLAATEFPAHVGSEDASERLTALVKEANRQAHEKGLGRVALEPMRVKDRELNQDAIRALLIQDVSTAATPTSVRLVAARDHVPGESEIVCNLRAVSVVHALSAGYVLATATIDGAQKEAQVFNQLLKLADLGADNARKLGVSPPQDFAQPDFYASGTNQLIFDALRDIRAIGGPASVTVQAAGDLSTIDPLSVQFVVKPVGP